VALGANVPGESRFEAAQTIVPFSMTILTSPAGLGVMYSKVAVRVNAEAGSIKN
jgi:hypothetical protein